MGEALAERGDRAPPQAARRGRARRVTIDLDPTDDPAHGQQQLALFNGYYDSWCYLPLLGFVSFNDEADQYLFTAVLRPGNAPDKLGARRGSSRVIAALRAAFPKARFRVRFDAGFAVRRFWTSWMIRAPRLRRGHRKNKILVATRQAAHGPGPAAFSGSGEDRARVRRDAGTPPGTGPQAARGHHKAEVTRHAGREPKNNPRFVVTNLSRPRAGLPTILEAG